MDWLLLQLFLLPLLWLESLYVPLHLGFVFNVVPLGRPFKMSLLKWAFGLELIPIYVCALFFDPLPLPGFKYIMWIHLLIHSIQAGQVILQSQCPELHVPVPFWVLLVGRMYVGLIDSFMHVSNVYRLGIHAHYYVLGSAGVFALSMFNGMNYEWTLRENEGKEVGYRKPY